MRTIHFLILAVFLLLSGDPFLLAGGKNEGPFWPDFHGPGRTNYSPETGLLRKWPEGGPPLAWKFSDCGKGWSGVTLAGGLIYTAGDFDDEERILALNLEGKLVWKTANGKAWKGSSPGSRTTPTHDSGLLFHMNPSGRLAAFQADTGREVWAVDLRERFEGQPGYWAYAENVLVEGDRVLCMPGGKKGRVVALNKKTGETIWTNTDIEDGAAYCSPVVITHQGTRQLLSLTKKTLVSVATDTGKLLWTHPYVPRSPQNALTPTYHDGHIFVACGHSTGGTLFRILPDQKGLQEVWSQKTLDNCHGGVILMNGNLYGPACRMGGRKFFCVDFLSGRLKQADPRLGKVGVTAAEDRIYALNHQGKVFLLAMKPEGFEIVSQFGLEPQPENTYLAHPVVCGGRLYLRGEEHLYAFDIKAH